MASSLTQQPALAPSPGFCIKSTALNSLSLPVDHNASSPIHISPGLKVFVNIAWDTNIPPPPDGRDHAIQRALSSIAPLHTDNVQPDTSIPLLLSHPRHDSDKAGKPSLVFDAIFNASLKSPALRSPECKSLLIELSFQRIEAQFSLRLSRQIGTPNIASKGKLKPRTALVPTSFFTSPTGTANETALIQELPSQSSPTTNSSAMARPKPPLKSPHLLPELSWSLAPDGRLRIALSAPHLTRAMLPHTTLDLEPHRLIFSAPSPASASSASTAGPSYLLDLDLSQPDASIQALFSTRRSFSTSTAPRKLSRSSASAPSTSMVPVPNGAPQKGCSSSMPDAQLSSAFSFP